MMDRAPPVSPKASRIPSAHSSQKRGIVKRLAKRPLLLLGLFSALLGGMTAGSGTAAAADSPTYEIVNDQTNGSLLPWYYGKNNRDNVHMMTRSPSKTKGADRWTLRSSRDGDFKLIRNEVTRKCLKPGGSSYRGNTIVVQGTCNDTLEFQWQLTPARYGTYEITSLSSGEVLAPDRGIGPYNNHVILEKDTNAQPQRWNLNQV